MDKVGAGLWKFDTRDLMRATTCSHCTAISIMRTLQVPAVLQRIEPYLEQEKTLAQKYGDVFEDTLTAELLASTSPGTLAEPEVSGPSMAERVTATIALMEAGTPVIYQGAVEHQDGITSFRGKPDFLVHEDWDLAFEDGKLTVRQMRETTGKGKYTAWDAKYASNAKPAYALQVALYITALEAAGWKAEDAKHGVILGSRKLELFSEGEVVPAMRLGRSELAKTIEEFVQLQESGQIEEFLAGFSWSCSRKSLCDICEYPDLCDSMRHQNDDLLLVHRITGVQAEKLASSGIHTTAQLATSNDSDCPANLDFAVFSRLRSQAKAQVRTRTEGRPYFELLPDPLIQYLPPRSHGDVYFDMEGFPYFQEKGGLEYLFGNWTPEGVFKPFWAHTRDEEKQAFIEFMEWTMARLEEDPNAHVYHYANYEKAALSKLATRHGVMELEVAKLEEQNKLVDLNTFVTKSLIVGQESYSIKYLEQYYGFTRDAQVKKATDSVDGYDAWCELRNAAQDESLSAEGRAEAQSEAAKLLADLEKYNREDVESTMALYDWLASMPGACSKYGADADPKVTEADERASAWALQLEELIEQTKELFKPLEDWRWGDNPALDTQALAWAALAHSILFYRREQVAYFTTLQIRMEQDDADMRADRKAVLLSHTVETSRAPSSDGGAIKVSYLAKLDLDSMYAPKPGEDVWLRAELPGGRQHRQSAKVLEVIGADIEFVATVKLGDPVGLPNAMLEKQIFNVDSKQAALWDLAKRIADLWLHPANPAPEGFAALDLLLRRSPNLKDKEALPRAAAEDALPAVLDAVKLLQNSTLAIQGPPGSGKTYVASHVISRLVAEGFRVGVVANSHKATENLLSACLEAGVGSNLIFKANKSGDKTEHPWQRPSSSGVLAKKAAAITDGVLIGGTSWTFAHEAVASTRFDYIFVDEAAQFSMVDALAVANSTKNLILLGDPQQLPQVVTAIHPGGVDNSALGHYMGDHEIIPSDRGYFIEVTRRLHPKVNAPVSWLSYENRLHSHESTQVNRAGTMEPGLILEPLDHKFNGTSSVEEVDAVMALVNRACRSDNLGQDDVLIVSPYNAQVDLIREALDAAGFTQLEVGTVDKFQGREAKLVIVSLAASSAEDAPRGLEFLLDRNRLNVAISRAKATCVVVFSSALWATSYRSLNELKAVSRFAGLTQFANG